MKLSALLLFCAAAGALTWSVPVPSRSLVFRAESDVNHVTLEPQKPLDLSSFTLCLRVATEMPWDRDIILFAYQSPGHDELNFWRERDGIISLYLRRPRGEDGVSFQLRPLSPMQTHVCVAWDSSTGATSVFIDGKKSLTKFYKKGVTVSHGGTVIIGQDADDQINNFDAKQSFVGEISDINLWSKVIPDCFIKEMATSGQTVRNGDVIDWKVVNLQVHGEVDILHREQ